MDGHHTRHFSVIIIAELTTDPPSPPTPAPDPRHSHLLTQTAQPERCAFVPTRHRTREIIAAMTKATSSPQIPSSTLVAIAPLLGSHHARCIGSTRRTKQTNGDAAKRSLAVIAAPRLFRLVCVISAFACMYALVMTSQDWTTLGLLHRRLF